MWKSRSFLSLSTSLPVTDCVSESSHPCSAGARHCGPEEASPVSVFKDVGQDAGEQAGAVQDDLTLFLRGAAGVCTLHQLLHRLRKKHTKKTEGLCPWKVKQRISCVLVSLLNVFIFSLVSNLQPLQTLTCGNNKQLHSFVSHCIQDGPKPAVHSLWVHLLK